MKYNHWLSLRCLYKILSLLVFDSIGWSCCVWKFLPSIFFIAYTSGSVIPTMTSLLDAVYLYLAHILSLVNPESEEENVREKIFLRKCTGHGESNPGRPVHLCATHIINDVLYNGMFQQKIRVCSYTCLYSTTHYFPE